MMIKAKVTIIKRLKPPSNFWFHWKCPSCGYTNMDKAKGSTNTYNLDCGACKARYKIKVTVEDK